MSWSLKMDIWLQRMKKTLYKFLVTSAHHNFKKTMMSCPNRLLLAKNWYILQTRMDHRAGPHENEFGFFSNSEMNVTNSYSGKSRWKNEVICIAPMFPYWVMVLNPITPGLFWCSNPWGGTKCPRSITQERNMET